MYVNDWKNSLVLLGAFTAYYTALCIAFWGSTVFAICWAEHYMAFSIAMFLYGLCWVAGMHISGGIGNKKARKVDLYDKIINKTIKDKEEEA